MGTDAHFLSSVRYVDDGAVAIAFSKDDPLSLIRAHQLRKSILTSCYLSSLELKEECIDNGSFRFLETMTTFSESGLHVEHFQKNAESIQANGCQRYFNVKHSASFESRSTKLGSVLSRFLSISRYTPNDERLYSLATSFTLELKLLQYSKRFLRAVCRRVAVHEPSRATVLASGC